jgi:hypothetical protein
METISQTFDEAIPLSAIHEHPENPRRGDDAAVAESVGVNGFFGAILVQRSTGHVLAGNTRLRVMREAGAEAVPGFWIDCDDATAHRILLADNRTSDLAFYDDVALVDLLTAVQTTDSLLGTGYDATAYELLLQAVSAESILGGVRQGLIPSERRDALEASGIRSIILPLGPGDYEVVVDGLAALRSAWSCDTNSEVVRRLVVEAAHDAA